ncbi:hypothetical protein AVEN_136493-1 [Araneus ventricosus]|uniref:Tc1-like transposase DDE domain-containing protein n=1 Tax=Araneus ventricosus TaxID=182803 RepID=A0A4Y2QZ84_ARAVE|nr:hypothetical protein AVEN_136493-1 [Araneus ventricosus]
MLKFPIVCPYACAVGESFILQDNVKPLRARLVENDHREETVVRIGWSARSPDLKPIQQIWDALERRCASFKQSPATL